MVKVENFAAYSEAVRTCGSCSRTPRRCRASVKGLQCRRRLCVCARPGAVARDPRSRRPRALAAPPCRAHVSGLVTWRGLWCDARAQEIKLSLATFALDVAEDGDQTPPGRKTPPPSPGEEVGKDGSVQELLAALRKRLRESEKTAGKLREELSALKADKDASDDQLQKSRGENHELRQQLAAATATATATAPAPRADREGTFGFELEERERLADYVSELEQERIVLAGMYRSASKRCEMLEQRLAARAQAAINLAKMEGKAPRVVEPAGDQSVRLEDDEAEGGHDGEKKEGAEDRSAGYALWDAPDEEETRDDDRWRRGDWGDAGTGVVGDALELTFSRLPLEQCRQLVTNSDNKLRVEDWVVRHACQQIGEYRYEPDLEGGADSASLCSSSYQGEPLLSISSSSDSGRRVQEMACVEGDAKPAAAGEGSARKPRGSNLREELRGYESMQVRANPMTGGVTRAAWKTGSFATPRRQAEGNVPHIFTSFLGSSVSPEKGARLPASVVSFGT